MTDVSDEEFWHLVAQISVQPSAETRMISPYSLFVATRSLPEACWCPSSMVAVSVYMEQQILQSDGVLSHEEPGSTFYFCCLPKYLKSKVGVRVMVNRVNDKATMCRSLMFPPSDTWHCGRWQYTPLPSHRSHLDLRTRGPPDPV